MPRTARVVAVGFPHHITQRGNFGQNIFEDDKDRKQYLLRIQEYIDKFNVGVLAYCLMSNHVHFIVIPSNENSLAKVFHTAHMKYSQYLNKKLNRRGQLWQGRFYSSILDDAHLIAATKYTERNPVRAGLVKKPWDWHWSSAKAHINSHKTPLLNLANLFDYIEISPQSWKTFIDNPTDLLTVEKIRKGISTNRPVGNEDFIKKLEKQFNRCLTSAPRGRPERPYNK